MKIVESLPSATVALFPSADALRAHLALNPTVRHVGTLNGIRSAPKEVRALLATYPDEAALRQAQAEAAFVDMQAHAAYRQHFASRAKL